MACPNCSFEIDMDAKPECPACGLIFEKWKKKHAPPPPVAASEKGPMAPAAPDVNDQIPSIAPEETFVLEKIGAMTGRFSLQGLKERVNIEGMAGFARRAGSWFRSFISWPFQKLAPHWNRWLKSQAENPREERMLIWSVLLVTLGVLTFAIGAWMITHPRYPDPGNIPAEVAPVNPGP